MSTYHISNSALRLWVVGLLAALTSVSLYPQDVFIRGQVVSDTTIRFSAKSAGPQYLLHYVVTRCDTSGACCSSHIEIWTLPDHQLLQTWSDTLSDEYPFVSFAAAPTFVDFNFDGYQDICLTCWWSSARPPSFLAFFRQYNPTSGRFDLAHQFDELQGEIYFLEDKTIRIFAEMGSAGQAWIETKYKYRGSKLVVIERVERRWEEGGFKTILQRPVKGVLKTVSVRSD